MEALQDDPRFVDMATRVENRLASTDIIERYLTTTMIDAEIDKLRQASISCPPHTGLPID